MRKLCLLIICLGIFAITLSPTTAQEDFPSPESLFSDAVEVISTEIVEEDNSINLVYDNELRTVRGFVDDEYREYPYPTDVYHISERIYPTWNNLLIYSQALGGYSQYWVLEPTSGIWELFDQQANCGEYSVGYLDTTISDRLWVFYIDEITSAVHLCATLTGELTPPLDLPDDYQPVPLTMFSDAYFTGLPSSPDLVYVVMFGRVDGEVHAYSYHFETGQLRDLGNLTLREEIRASLWLDNTHLLITVRDDDTCDRYIADVTDTIEWVTESCESFYRNPDRFVQTNVEYDEDYDVIDCSREIYFIDTRESVTYEYGKLCYPDLGSDIGVGYYREISEDLTQVNIVRFDPTTGERGVLYSGGAIEEIRWISADERYAVLLFDAEDIVNNTPQGGDIRLTEPRLAYVDLTSGAVLYETGIPTSQDNANDYAPSIITPLTDDILLVKYRETEFEYIPGTDAWYINIVDVSSSLVQLDNDQPIVSFPPIQVIFPERLQLIYWSENRESLLAYDIATATTFTIIPQTPSADWQILVSQGDGENTLTVRIRRAVNGIPDLSHTVVYTVRLP